MTIGVGLFADTGLGELGGVAESAGVFGVVFGVLWLLPVGVDSEVGGLGTSLGGSLLILAALVSEIDD